MKYLDINDIHKIETKLIEICDKICLENNINYTLVCGSVLGAVRHGGPIPWDTDVDMTIAYDDLERFVQAMKKNMPIWCGIDLPENSKTSVVSFPRVYVKGIDPIYLHIDVFANVGLPDSRQEQIRYYKKTEKLNKALYYKNCKINTQYYLSRNCIFALANKIRRLLMKIILLPFSKKYIIKLLKEHFSQYSFNNCGYVLNPANHYGLKSITERRYYENIVRVKYDGLEVNIPKDYEDYLKHYYDDWMKYPSEEEINRGLQYKIAVSSDFDVSNYK